MRLNNIRIIREKCHRHCRQLISNQTGGQTESKYCSLFNSDIKNENRTALCVSMYGIVSDGPMKAIQHIKKHYNKCAIVHKNEVDWRDLKLENHKQHLFDHVEAFKKGDKSDTHLQNIILRALMIQEIILNKPE